MSDVIYFRKENNPSSIPPYKESPLKNAFGSDDWILKMCADWRAARAQMQKKLG